MAEGRLRPKAVNGRANGVARPSKIEPIASQAGSLEQLKKDAARMPSRVIRLRDKESITVRFLDQPPAWTKFSEHGIQRNGFWSRVPCHRGCKLDNDITARAATRWMANVVDVGTGDVRLLYLTKNMVDSFIIKYERSRGKAGDKEPTLTNRNYTIVRIGSDQDTKYEIDAEELGPLEIDGKTVKLSSFEKLDAREELTFEIESYYGANVRRAPKAGRMEDEDEDEEIEDLDEDEEEDVEEEDDEEEDEEEEEPAPKRGARRPVAVEDDEEDEEEDDEVEDEDEDEEEDEEPVRPVARRVQRKPLPSAKTAKPVRPASRATTTARRR